MLFALLVLLSVYKLDEWRNADGLQVARLHDFFLSVSSSLIAAVVFFSLFTWGLYWVNRRRPFFRFLTESEDFTDEGIKHAYEEAAKKLAAFNESFRISLDIHSVDFRSESVSVNVEIISEIRNLSRFSPYEDEKIIRHDPTGPSSKESCEIAFAGSARRFEELHNARNVLDDISVTSTKEGVKSVPLPIHMGPGEALWTRTVYKYKWPLRLPDVPLEECEEHMFSSPRFSKKMELRARNLSEMCCRLIVESTREGKEGHWDLPEKMADFKQVVSIDKPIVQPHDTGCVQVYIEAQKPANG